MDHRSHDETECVVAKLQGVALFHGLYAVGEIGLGEELGEHCCRFCRCHYFQSGPPVDSFHYACRMVGLHVLHYEVVDGATVCSFADLTQPLVGMTCFHGVHDGYLPVNDGV